MQQLPPELQKFQPSQNFQNALTQLNQGLVEAGNRSSKPISANQALGEVMIPLFNLMTQYIKMSQLDTYRYFYGFCAFLYQQQLQGAEDNIILAVDPDLADEVDGVVEAARGNIEQAKKYIGKVQEYLAANKPARIEEIVKEGSEPDMEAKAAADARIEMHQALREEALRVLSALQESFEDLGVMSDNVANATYEAEPEEGEEEEEAPQDEVALPTSMPPEPADEPYESVVG